MKKKSLTTKQNQFVEHYLRTFNGTEAARCAKYKGNANTLAAVAYENLRKPHIRARIEERLAETAMSANEVLVRLSDQATASVADFVEASPIEGKPGRFILDMGEVRKRGHLVKKIRYTQHGLEVELHDAQSALVHLGKYHKLFADRMEVTGRDGGPVQVREVRIELSSDEA